MRVGYIVYVKNVYILTVLKNKKFNSENCSLKKIQRLNGVYSECYLWNRIVI